MTVVKCGRRRTFLSIVAFLLALSLRRSWAVLQDDARGPTNDADTFNAFDDDSDMPTQSYRRTNQVPSFARVHRDAASSKPRSYYDYTRYKLELHSPLPYHTTEHLGSGKYGDVYQGHHTGTGQHFAIKVLDDPKYEKLQREVMILHYMEGAPSVIKLHEVVHDPQGDAYALVMQLVPGGPLNTTTLPNEEVMRSYMRQVLEALEHAHSRGIMHRDVKKGNILVEERTGRVWLIDWGLSDFYLPGKEYPVRVATRAYKGPELLLGIRDYDYSLDIWSLGCVFGAMMFRKSQLFRAEDDWGQLRRIARVLGTRDLDAYVEKYRVSNPEYARVRATMGDLPRVPWASMVDDSNSALATDAAINLLDRMLRYDHQDRISAAEALQHPFFAGAGADAGAGSAAGEVAGTGRGAKRRFDEL